MTRECEPKPKSETTIFILLAHIVCRHTLPRQAASSSGWSCSEQMCPTVCYVSTLSCRFIFWFAEVSCFGTACLLFRPCLPAHNNLSQHTCAHACLQSIHFTGGADIFLFLNCITSTIRGTARQQIGCKNFWNADVSAPTQHNAPSEWRHLICVYGYSRPT